MTRPISNPLLCRNRAKLNINKLLEWVIYAVTPGVNRHRPRLPEGVFGRVRPVVLPSPIALVALLSWVEGFRPF
jgi:hypothetical protein